MKSLTEFMLAEDNVSLDGFEFLQNKSGSLVVQSPKGNQLIFTKESNYVTIGVADGSAINMIKIPLEVYKLIHRKMK